MNDYINHARNHSYMSGVERDALRVKMTAEVFTPTHMVHELLDKLESENPSRFTDPDVTFLDPSCGDGQILSEVIIRKMGKSGCSLLNAISTTYGVELMEDNVNLCKERLAGPNPSEEIIKILDNNIVCYDALKYHYRFDGTDGNITKQDLNSHKFFE